MDEQVILVLTRDVSPNYSGDRAGFSPQAAKRLLDQGAGYPADAEQQALCAKLGILPVPAEGEAAAPAGAPAGTPPGPKADTRTHEVNADEAIALVGKETTLDALEALFLGEREHPKQGGGRKTVLNAIRERAAAVKAEQEKAAAGGGEPPGGQT